MSFLKNTVSLLAIFSVLPAAHAVTSRLSVMNTAASLGANAARRMPTVASYITGVANSAVSSGTTSTSLYQDSECIDAYTACIKGADACGPNFEECTTNVLFHAQMPECLSTLAQCSSNGVNSLFGTSNISALSNVATKNTYGEITEYTYPTAGSVLGQMISAAAISNKYDTSNCVRRYSSCLRKDSVCGADFELCTTNTEFKKQAVFCDSTLARCAAEGKLELFGNAVATSSTVPSATSRIGEMIAQGAALAAVNSVSTCYKVVDQCILNTCGANPYKCYADSSVQVQSLVDSINNGTPITDAVDQFSTGVYSAQNIRAYVKNACESTIGSNKYCYATFIGDGQMPTASQLQDEDNQADIFDQAYSARMNSGMRAKIEDLINKFDTRAKEKCLETITGCAMRSCGGGSGAACYSLVFSNSGENSINGGATRNEIKTACQSVVNTDANCLYAAKNPNSVGTYNYSFIQADAFDTLFPEYDDGAESDPIGAIASLNAKLSTSYNTAAIAQMKKRCQSVATSCVKSMCGNDYVNCYRNRTDIQSSLTNTGEDGFDKSMNKVGGVLDYTIVLGLCIDTVKNADVCSEHLKIEEVKYNMDNTNENVWGGASDVRSGWIGAGSAKSSVGTGEIYATDENGNRLCTNNAGVQGPCDTVDENGAVYSEPVVIGYDTYVQTQAARSLFKDLIYDLEIEAQAKYNAKLTKQQNMCLAENRAGGIVGTSGSSTFMWAKLKTDRVPSNYTVAGLLPNQFAASNDLYGSFCAVRVTLQSDDKNIQGVLNNARTNNAYNTRYFAAGDSFTCGSWIPQSVLEDIAKKVGDTAATDKKNSQHRKIVEPWTAVVGLLGGGAGGAYLGAGIQDGSIFNGLTSKPKKNARELTVENCNKYYTSYIAAVKSNNVNTVSIYVNNLIDLVESTNTADEGVTSPAGTRTALFDYQSALSNAGQTFVDQYGSASERNCTGEEMEKRAISKANAKIREIAPGCPRQFHDFEDYEIACLDSSKDMKIGSTNYEQTCCGSNNTTYEVVRAAYDSIFQFPDDCKVSVAARVTQTVAQQQNAANQNVLAKKNALDKEMSALRSDCVILANNDANNKDQAKKKRNAAIVGASVTAVASGALTWGVARSIMDVQVDEARQAAIKEFMDNVGSKIRCYIGGDEVGMYGDVISTSME